MNTPAPTWFVLINPAAGKGQAGARWQKLALFLQNRNIAYQAAFSSAPGELSSLAEKALSDGYTHFLSIGGDGTHHEVVNGFMKGRRIHPPVLAVLSCGSGNDWVKSYGIPTRVQEIPALLTQCNTISHPVGLVTFQYNDVRHTRYMINVTGMALDGHVVETYPPAFRRIPFLPGYLIAGLRHLMTYRAKPMQITAQGKEYSGKFFTVHAGIGRYSGGGMQFVPHADATSNQLAVTLVRKMGRWRLLANLYRLYTRTLPSHPKVTAFHTTEFSAEGTRIPVEADGEFLGFTPVHITLVPDAFRLVIPGSR